MGIAAQLQQLAEDVSIIPDIKEGIRQALIEKNVLVPEATPFSDYPGLVSNIQSGGGSSSVNGYLVRFIEYDGTILKDEYVQPGGSATPPANPLGDDILKFLGWHGNYQNVTRDEVVGPRYWFGSGADLRSYLFVNLDATSGLTINIRLYITTGAATIYWGDGTNSVTSGTGDKITPHTYASTGNYRIAIDGLQVNGNELGARGSNTYSVVDVQRALVKAYIGWPTVIGRYCFRNCDSLRAVCLSFIGSTNGAGNLQGFGFTKALKALIVPSTYKLYAPYDNAFTESAIRYFIMPTGGMDSYSISGNFFVSCKNLEFVSLYPAFLAGQYVFNGCTQLKRIAFGDIPTSVVKQLGAGTLMQCLSLESVILPSNVADISSQIFYQCYSLRSIDFPATVTNFNTNVVDYCWNLKTVIVRSLIPPTISGTNPLSVLARTPVDQKFYVPDASVDAYKAATGWLTIADRIYPLSELPA